MNSFPDLLAAAHRHGDSLTYPIPDEWGQGRATFGGLVSSLAVHAMRAFIDEERPLRTLQVNFIGPVPPGQMRVDIQQLRSGKNVSQVEARVVQDGTLAAVLIGVFGGGRSSVLPTRLPVQPTSRAPDVVPEMPFRAGAMPNFLQHVGFRWAEGDPPFTGGDAMHSRLHVMLRHNASGVSAELLTVLLSDAPPTPVLGHFETITTASSVSWVLELLPLTTPPGDGWWRVDTDVNAYADGYAHQHSRLWTPDGQLAALGTQMVAVFG